MKAIDLNGQWSMRKSGSKERYEASIPGTVASTLLSHGCIKDPYIRNNEAEALPIFEYDYEFSRNFHVDEDTLSHDKVILHCDGLDTLADIFLNGVKVSSVDNMHRTYLFDVKKLLRQGENRIAILFHSPVKYVRSKPTQAGMIFTPIRKAACMFGWDWGINLPDMGIWRDIYIETFDAGRIKHVAVRQKHTDSKVDLEIKPQCEVWDSDSLSVQVSLVSPDGVELHSEIKELQGNKENIFNIKVSRPELWWPAGYGKQPLYTVKTQILRNGSVVDQRIQRIGLRTVLLNREPDGEGSKYEFIVNGKQIYVRGENLVIHDAFVTRSGKREWKKLIDNCIKSNLNCIRVWGGAYYPPDVFYDLCDERGIMVYQDMMFACAFYPTNRKFLRNVQMEITDNLQRICHHACICLLCGNNEIELIYMIMKSTDPDVVAMRKMFGGGDKPLSRIILAYILRKYKILFLKLIQRVCRQYAPDLCYVHSSPSTRKPGGANSMHDYLSDGDLHYYLQYDSNAPYQKIRTMRSRFVSEIGFQSYPSMKTIRSFTDEEDRSPYSPVMLSHQKCRNGNETIELYMERDYIVPKDFSDYVYLSQLQAGEITKYTVEHFRRDRAYCSGIILWQLNDCWPVVSWSGIDYYGRWKAMQYYVKQSFEPVLVSAHDEGAKVGLWVTNDEPAAFNGRLIWSLYEKNSVVRTGESTINVDPGSSAEYITLDFSDLIDSETKGKYHLVYKLVSDSDQEVGSGTVLFCLAKEFEFEEPDISLSVTEADDCYIIDVSTYCFAKGIMLDTKKGDCIFSDNWFDLSANDTKRVYVKKEDVAGIGSLEEMKEELFVTSLNDVMIKQLVIS